MTVWAESYTIQVRVAIYIYLHKRGDWMFYLRTEDAFDAAHFLEGYTGKCSNIHGHRWRVVAELKGENLKTDPQERGMLMDFSEFKKELREICERFDHRLVVELGTLSDTLMAEFDKMGFAVIEVPFRPTSEELARFFYEELKNKGLNIHKVEMYETPTNCAVYGEDI